jgi:hypothetical protein
MGPSYVTVPSAEAAVTITELEPEMSSSSGLAFTVVVAAISAPVSAIVVTKVFVFIIFSISSLSFTLLFVACLTSVLLGTFDDMVLMQAPCQLLKHRPKSLTKTSQHACIE